MNICLKSCDVIKVNPNSSSQSFKVKYPFINMRCDITITFRISVILRNKLGHFVETLWCDKAITYRIMPIHRKTLKWLRWNFVMRCDCRNRISHTMLPIEISTIYYEHSWYNAKSSINRNMICQVWNKPTNSTCQLNSHRNRNNTRIFFGHSACNSWFAICDGSTRIKIIQSLIAKSQSCDTYSKRTIGKLAIRHILIRH